MIKSIRKTLYYLIEHKRQIIVGFIRLSFVLAIGLSIYELNWMSVFVSFLGLLLTTLPYILHSRYKIILPKSIQFYIILFIYASIFLGEFFDVYHRLRRWDSMLHFLAGIGLGFIGFLILIVLKQTHKFKADPLRIAIFAFCFAMALGGLREIFEFLVDQFFYANMQRARYLCYIGQKLCDTRLGVVDTMIDLILNAIGGLIASVISYIHIKNPQIKFLKSRIDEVKKSNKNKL